MMLFRYMSWTVGLPEGARSLSVNLSSSKALCHLMDCLSGSVLVGPVVFLLGRCPNQKLTMCSFLLARLIVNDLLRTSSRKELRKALVGLPKTLPEMYRKTMDQIKRSRHADLATRVVQRVILTARPLRVQELRHGLAVELGTSEQSPSSRSLFHASKGSNRPTGSLQARPCSEKRANDTIWL